MSDDGRRRNVHVKMLNSVAEYVAGEEYDLDDETSDRFVILGYAEGEKSRVYPPEELAVFTEGHQTVGL